MFDGITESVSGSLLGETYYLFGKKDRKMTIGENLIKLYIL